MEGKHRHRVAEGEVHGLVGLVLDEEHRRLRDGGGPFLDFDAVEVVELHVHEVFGHEGQLGAGRVEFLEALVNLEFEGAKFAVGDDEEVSAATRRVEQVQLTKVRKQLGEVALAVVRLRESFLEFVEEQGPDCLRMFVSVV